MYVFIKELKAKENEVFVVISQLTKDVSQTENEMYKANALRVLSKIIDDPYVQSLEKFLKQALIDKSNYVVSAALVSLINLYKKGGHSMEIVRKSVNEIQDKLLNSGDGNLQYQALLILFELKKNDQMAVLKVLYQLT
jgi:coatomer protein complex subunit gamma